MTHRDESTHFDYTDAPKVDDTTHISVTRPSQGSGTDSSTGGTSSIKIPQMTPLKAVVLYLMPIFVAWFGGLFSDLL